MTNSTSHFTSCLSYGEIYVVAVPSNREVHYAKYSKIRSASFNGIRYEAGSVTIRYEERCVIRPAFVMSPMDLLVRTCSTDKWLNVQRPSRNKLFFSVGDDPSNKSWKEKHNIIYHMAGNDPFRTFTPPSSVNIFPTGGAAFSFTPWTRPGQAALGLAVWRERLTALLRRGISALQKTETGHPESSGDTDHSQIAHSATDGCSWTMEN
ncbi:hypothetical protein J6590_039430 [Homalodisca vitripennis]|nr:hypothetical protein J6590_039430 [Homalodisca vitripennis]